LERDFHIHFISHRYAQWVAIKRISSICVLGDVQNFLNLRDALQDGNLDPSFKVAPAILQP